MYFVIQAFDYPDSGIPLFLSFGHIVKLKFNPKILMTDGNLPLIFLACKQIAPIAQDTGLYPESWRARYWRYTGRAAVTLECKQRGFLQTRIL